MNSAIYKGSVRHRRFTPVEHAFRYELFYVYLDLDELPEALDGLPGWSARRAAPARFARSDHFGDPDAPLAQSVRALVEERTGTRPDGSIRLLALPRTFGIAFNPVSFYYCHRQDESLSHIVAEVTNTPWGERHCYVVDVERENLGTGRVMRFRVPKTFHVSPFHPIEQEYEWCFTRPERSLLVHMENHEDGELKTDATLALRREPLDAKHAGRALRQQPAVVLSALGSIYKEAARLWWKGAPYHPHPKKLAERAGEQAS